MKKIKVLSCIALLSTLGLVACNNTTSSSSSGSSSTPVSESSSSNIENSSVSESLSSSSILIDFEAELESAAIEVGQTTKVKLTLKGLENPTVTYSSSDTKIATVTDSGEITGISVGNVDITVKVNDELTKVLKLEVTEKTPTEVSISGYETTTVTTNTQVQLSATVAPSDAASGIKWTSSSDEIATVSDTGLVSFIDQGEVTITATSTKNEEIKDEVTFNANYIIDTFWGKESWDFTGLKGTNPSFKSNSNTINQNAVLKNVKGKYYVFEATAKVTDPVTTDTWSRIGLGHIPEDDGSRIHTTIISPGPNFSQKKIVTMDLVNGGVQWGITTDRSQVWGQHGINNLNFDSIKLTAIRNGNDYYTFINDELYWKEVGYMDFADVDTLPAFHAANLSVEYSNISYTVDPEEVANKVNETASKKIFYASYAENVQISDDNKTIKFVNADTAPTNVKDNAAWSIGNAVSLPGDKTSKISFDMVIDKFGSQDGEPAVVVSMPRYDREAPQTRSWIIAETRAGFTGWDRNGNLPAGVGDGGRTYATPLVEGTSYHVECTKLPGCDTKISVNGVEYAHGWVDGYTDSHVLFFSTRNLDATLSNITITVEE